MYYYNGKPSTRCPYKYKYQLVEYAVKNLGFSLSKAQKMTKKQLYAVYYDKPHGISVKWAEYAENRIIDDMINKARGK